MKTRYIKHKNILGMNYENVYFIYMQNIPAIKKPPWLTWSFYVVFKFMEFLNLSKVWT